MTNNLVGDVYQKVIEEVVAESTRDFEESGVGSTTLGELQQEWQSKLSQRGVAQMPWDPKPAPQPSPKPPTTAPTANNPSSSNNLPPSSYSTYEQPPSTATANGPRIKTEPDVEPQYAGMQGGYPQAAPPQGGAARAQQLVQEQFGPNAINGMQRGGGGLALPGGQQQHPQQQQQQAKPQGLQLPAGSPHPGQQQQQQHLSPQQQQQQAMQRQQQQLQQQQAQPRIKVENDNPSYQQQHQQQRQYQQQQQQQRQYQQQQQQPPSNYGQTDGGGDDVEDPHEQWQRMLAERRAIAAEHGRQADRMMREHVMQSSDALQNGLMVPMNEQPGKSRKRKAKAIASSSAVSTSAAPTIPQLDGDVDDEESKTGIKEEDDENAINSDLDDSDEEAQGNMGDDDDDGVDSILCTYDKVQRVKNKWKCILKDGVMNVGGKEWVFHKGTGEFEW